MEDSDPLDFFIAEMNGVQQPLYRYLLTLIPRADDAYEVLSETNMALWRRRAEYDRSREFWPWACRFAQMQALSFHKRRQRDRLMFRPELFDLLEQEAAERMQTQQRGEFAKRQLQALEECVEKLDDRQRALIEQRYQSAASVAEIAERLGRTPAAVSESLYRIRLALGRCIRTKLRSEGDA